MRRRTQGKSTIYDVARKARASPSTVSAALNGTWVKRRISRATVARIQEIARDAGYSVNLQARGLRQARSGLVGMILPDHENRFFASLSEAFANETRRRGRCPAIVPTGREPEDQARAVESLVSYAVDSLMLVGASAPDALARRCRAAGIPHVFVDLPCADAPSVVSDNALGAHLLTDALLDRIPALEAADPRSHLYFLGGDASLHASARRIAGFQCAARQRDAFFGDHQVLACGYDGERAIDEIGALHERLGRLPSGLLVNSIEVFGGVVRFLGRLEPAEIAHCAIGCYDFDPLMGLLRFPVHMVRQRADALMAQAYRHLDTESFGPSLTLVRPDLLIATS